MQRGQHLWLLGWRMKRPSRVLWLALDREPPRRSPLRKRRAAKLTASAVGSGTVGKSKKAAARAFGSRNLRIIGPATLKGGEVSADDRSYASRLIAARTGISQSEAEQRVNQTIAQAKEAADRARRAAAKFSLWIAVSLLAGAFSGSLAAAEGGKLRNERWYEEAAATTTTNVRR